MLLQRLTKNIKTVLSVLTVLMTVAGARAADPTATSYSWQQCQGSLRPYVEPGDYTYPDSLTPVFINHVGRHGARFPAGSGTTVGLIKVLERADSLKTITPLGRQMLTLAREVVRRTAGQWGALDSLGMAEQRGIATRMYRRFEKLFAGSRVDALSSYSPRCIMSMYSFTHQLSRMNNKLEIFTNSGRQNSLLMRPFDVEADYKEFRESEAWRPAYDDYIGKMIPLTALRRLVGEGLALTDDEARTAALNEYYVLAGMEAMSMSVDASKFLNKAEQNALWSCFNLRQYLQRTATTVSTVPADIASPLLIDLMNSIQAVVDGLPSPAVRLRFGHAETLMPLLSLMHLKGCYYMTNYFDTVGMHWRDFDVVPMAANLQMVLFRSKKGAYYICVFHNEVPVPLIPGTDTLYVKWETARDYLNRCVPIYYQLAM